jgi:hypothetical protein
MNSGEAIGVLGLGGIVARTVERSDPICLTVIPACGTRIARAKQPNAGGLDPSIMERRDIAPA